MGLCAISFSVDQYGHAQTQGQLNTSGPSSMNVNQTNATSANIIKLVDGQLPHKPVERVALVEPTFTYAAYQNGSFYNFYTKYSNLLWDDDRSIVLITTDLDLLKDRPIPHGPFHSIHTLNIMIYHISITLTFYYNTYKKILLLYQKLLMLMSMKEISFKITGKMLMMFCFCFILNMLRNRNTTTSKSLYQMVVL
jgi:hypothetical protein